MSKRLSFEEILELNGGCFDLKITFEQDCIKLHVADDDVGIMISNILNEEHNCSYNKKEYIDWNFELPYASLELIGDELSDEDVEDVKELIDKLIKKDEHNQKILEEREERRRLREEKREREQREFEEMEREAYRKQREREQQERDSWARRRW